MAKTILITGATDGIGLETAMALAADGHRLLLHGRSSGKLEKAAARVGAVAAIPPETYLADLSDLAATRGLARDVASAHETLDALINNAGVFKLTDPLTPDGLDARFVVNTIAPYLLTLELLPLLGDSARVVNLSSAAQSDLDLEALAGKRRAGSDMDAYAQSKTAITAWTRALAEKLGSEGPMIVAVNPGSMLASKMVKEGFGVAGNDLGIGVDILRRAALSDEFADAGGRYFDNDSGNFAQPHRDAGDPVMGENLLGVLDDLLAK